MPRVSIYQTIPCACGSSVGGPFTPGAIPNLAGWFDASRTDTMFSDTGGTTPAGDLTGLGLWKDLSGNVRDVSQASGLQRFTRNASVSPSVLTPDGGDRMFSAAFTAVPQPYCALAITDALVNSTTFFDNGVAGTRNLMQRGAAATEITLFAGTAGATFTGVPSLDTRRAVLAVFNGAASQVWVFDAGTNLFVQVGGNLNAGTNTLADFKLGGNGSNFLTANLLSEFIFFAGTSDATLRGNLGLYAKAKWSLT